MAPYTVIGHYTVEDVRKMVSFEAEAGDGEYSPKTEVIKFLLNEIERKETALTNAAYEAWLNEVIHTDMRDLLVGEGLKYADYQDFLDTRIAEWMPATVALLSGEEGVTWQQAT